MCLCLVNYPDKNKGLMNSSGSSNTKVLLRSSCWWSLISPSLGTQKRTGKMLVFPQSEYQTRQRRQETGQRAVLQPHGRSHYCHGAAVVHSQVTCLTKMDFPSHFAWSNTLQNWSHILVFYSTLDLKDILTSALSGAQISLHVVPAPLLATGRKGRECLLGNLTNTSNERHQKD